MTQGGPCSESDGHMDSSLETLWTRQVTPASAGAVAVRRTSIMQDTSCTSGHLWSLKCEPERSRTSVGSEIIHQSVLVSMAIQLTILLYV
jgi:hypothetical protein